MRDLFALKSARWWIDFTAAAIQYYGPSGLLALLVFAPLLAH